MIDCSPGNYPGYPLCPCISYLTHGRCGVVPCTHEYPGSPHDLERQAGLKETTRVLSQQEIGDEIIPYVMRALNMSEEEAREKVRVWNEKNTLTRASRDRLIVDLSRELRGG